MAGRPPLRVGQHGTIKRIQLEPGVWVARCRFRDADGVTRIVERRSPKPDQRGKAAEDALIEALKARRPPGVSGDITLDTYVSELVAQHLAILEENHKSPATMTTYRSAQRQMLRYTEAMRVGEATPGRLNAVIKSIRAANGVNMARHTRTILRGALQIAVLDDVLGANPVIQVSRIESERKPQGAPALEALELKDLLALIQTSETCKQMDLVDPITLFIATGLRRSELLACLWDDFNERDGTLAVSGKIVRVQGKGLKRFDIGKTVSSLRVVPLPAFAVTALTERHASGSHYSEYPMIFPSTVGSYRDPDNFNKQWRKVRAELNVPDVTSHSFRKSLVTLIDDEGMSARIGADQLGHSKVSMTQDRYMRRGKIHREVADLLDRSLAVDKQPEGVDISTVCVVD